jgi:hypothetical protein
MSVHYPASHTRSEQLDALEARPQPEDALEGEVIPPGFRCQPQEPIRTVEEQLAMLQAAMDRERTANDDRSAA